jgi:ribosomal protein L12E/L44/L45/RPP1/RPP2
VHEPGNGVVGNGAATNGAATNGAATNGDGPIARLFVNAGKRHGVTREALAEAFAASGVEPQRVRMHHTYGLVDVPQERADELVAALTGRELAGRTLNVELAREQPAAV